MMVTNNSDIRLLLTGFQGWGDIKTNPSELIGQQLDGAVLHLKGRPETSESPASLVEDADPSLERSAMSTRAIVSFKPIRVSYREIEKVVPQIHTSREWDCIVHVGLAKGNKDCTIEIGSNSVGYPFEDVDGELAPEVGHGRGVEGTVSHWDCTLDCQGCCEELNNMGYSHVKLSSDPGNFCCGYIMACSLKCAYSCIEQDPKRKPIPVVFLHVPEPKENDPTAPYTLSELTEIVRALCNFTARESVTAKS